MQHNLNFVTVNISCCINVRQTHKNTHFVFYGGLCACHYFNIALFDLQINYHLIVLFSISLICHSLATSSTRSNKSSPREATLNNSHFHISTDMFTHNVFHKAESALKLPFKLVSKYIKNTPQFFLQMVHIYSY